MGNTSELHRHIHVKIGGDERETLYGVGIPIVFEGKHLNRNGIYKGAIELLMPLLAAAPVL